MGEKENSGLSRRDFLKGAATVVGGVAIAGLVSGCERDKKEYCPETLIMIFGQYGTYKTEYDKIEKKYTLGFWESNTVIPGRKDLVDLKIEGGRIPFTMPFDGTINNSAGRIVVDGQEWNLGNPAVGEDMNPIVLQGQIVELEYEPNNDSAGFQIYFEN